MNKEIRQRIVARHSDSLLRYGVHPHALYWSSREVQALRFRILSEVGVASGDTVLDVGCGFADLKSWLETQGLDIYYTGLDISPDLIAVAKGQHPDAVLHIGELVDCTFPEGCFDWVLLSGALNEPYADEGKYTRYMIQQMYELSRKGVAFNLLNANAVQAPDLQSFDAKDMLVFCETLCASCVLRTDYLQNDFTIYMHK